MSCPYEKNKIYLKRWRLKYPEKYKENNRVQQRKSYAKRKAWREIAHVFRNILVDKDAT